MKKLTVIMAVIGCVMAEMLAMNISAGAVNTQAIETTYEVGDTSHCEPWMYETQDPTGAWSEGGTFGVSGKLSWRINPETNEMIISGEGAMDDYYYGWYAIVGRPWEQWKSTIESIVIEEGITRIGNYAFSDFDKLQSVSIPDTVTTIGSYAFHRCSGLQTVDIPPSVTTIGFDAFLSTHLREIVLPDSVTTVESGAFSDCPNVERVILSENLTHVGHEAFSSTLWYNALKRDENGLIASNGIIFNAYEKATKQLGTVAYTYNSGTVKGDIILPEDTKVIADCAFSGCSEMTSIVLPNGLRGIGFEAFQDCEKLESITIPDSVTKIQNFTFQGCTALSEIQLSPNITSVGAFAFMDCDSLESVTFPESVEELGDLLFGYETNIKDITVLNPHCRFGEICKRDSRTVKFNHSVTMHGYPYSTAQAFAEASGWNFVPIGAETAVSGDANGDNEFSLVDVVQVHKMLQTRKAPPKSCDMNKDNIVNVIDLALMKQKLFKNKVDKTS